MNRTQVLVALLIALQGAGSSYADACLAGGLVSWPECAVNAECGVCDSMGGCLDPTQKIRGTRSTKGVVFFEVECGVEFTDLRPCSKTWNCISPSECPIYPVIHCTHDPDSASTITRLDWTYTGFKCPSGEVQQGCSEMPQLGPGG